ncbi:hypothetical protein O3P69_014422 [Scylla paramamosain]|uniref:Uncharacterized protein n=1 Tax=Scylla paramamosain TaxID=85552 RepID=A0AAW0TC24_SCYPA
MHSVCLPVNSSLYEGEHRIVSWALAGCHGWQRPAHLRIGKKYDIAGGNTVTQARRTAAATAGGLSRAPITPTPCSLTSLELRKQCGGLSLRCLRLAAHPGRGARALFPVCFPSINQSRVSSSIDLPSAAALSSVSGADPNAAHSPGVEMERWTSVIGGQTSGGVKGAMEGTWICGAEMELVKGG